MKTESSSKPISLKRFRRTVCDRALQRSTAEVLSAIYEQDFLPCSFGGRPKLSAHHALATLNEVIAGGKIGWVLEADLKNFSKFAMKTHNQVSAVVGSRPVGLPSREQPNLPAASRPHSPCVFKE